MIRDIQAHSSSHPAGGLGSYFCAPSPMSLSQVYCEPIMCLESCPSSSPPWLSPLITFPGWKPWLGSQATQTQWGVSCHSPQGTCYQVLLCLLVGEGSGKLEIEAGGCGEIYAQLLPREQGYWGVIEGL